MVRLQLTVHQGSTVVPHFARHCYVEGKRSRWRYSLTHSLKHTHTLTHVSLIYTLISRIKFKSTIFNRDQESGLLVIWDQRVALQICLSLLLLQQSALESAHLLHLMMRLFSLFLLVNIVQAYSHQLTFAWWALAGVPRKNPRRQEENKPTAHRQTPGWPIDLNQATVLVCPKDSANRCAAHICTHLVLFIS